MKCQHAYNMQTSLCFFSRVYGFFAEHKPAQRCVLSICFTVPKLHFSFSCSSCAVIADGRKNKSFGMLRVVCYPIPAVFTTSGKAKRCSSGLMLHLDTQNTLKSFRFIIYLFIYYNLLELVVWHNCCYHFLQRCICLYIYLSFIHPNIYVSIHPTIVYSSKSDTSTIHPSYMHPSFFYIYHTCIHHLSIQVYPSVLLSSVHHLYIKNLSFHPPIYSFRDLTYTLKQRFLWCWLKSVKWKHAFIEYKKTKSKFSAHLLRRCHCSTPLQRHWHLADVRLSAQLPDNPNLRGGEWAELKLGWIEPGWGELSLKRPGYYGWNWRTSKHPHLTDSTKHEDLDSCWW